MEAFPLAKLRSQCAATPSDDGKRRVVLLTTGSYNPITLGHVAMLTHARMHLEQAHNCRVLAGWLSPAQQEFVDKKMQKKQKEVDTSRNVRALPLEARAEMLGFSSEMRVAASVAAVQESDWLDVSHWEHQSGKVRFFNEVASECEMHLKAAGISDVEIMYVMGEDTYKRSAKWGLESTYKGEPCVPGITHPDRAKPGEAYDGPYVGVVIERAVSDVDTNYGPLTIADPSLFLRVPSLPGEGADTSSTVVRRALLARDMPQLDLLLAPAVRDVLVNSAEVRRLQD